MPKLGGVQALRAFAAIMVLVGHAIAEAEHYFAISLHLDFIPWTRGVDIFFVISGFIVTLSAKRYTGRPVAFLSRRAMRVIPLYYLFTTLMVITVFVFPNGPKETVFDLNQIASSYGFFPYQRGDGRIAPILSLGWTLNYEMFFYVLCAISLLLHRSTSALVLGIFVIVILGAVSEPKQATLSFWVNSIIIEFIFGIILAKVYQTGWSLPNFKLAALVFGVSLALLIMLDTADLSRFLAAGVPALLIVAAATLFCPPAFERWQTLGDASYALYLSHRFTLRVGTILLIPILPNSAIGSWVYIFAISILSIGVALMVHLWLERPFLMPLKKQAIT